MRFLLFLLTLLGCQRTTPDGQIHWQNYTKGEASQSAGERPILFRFDAKWCPYCLRLEETLFKDKAVVSLSKQFQVIKVDGDLPGADPLMKKYHVQGYPTLIFADKDGSPLAAWGSDPDSQKFAALMMDILHRSEPHPSWQEFLEGKLKEVDLAEDPYWIQAEGLEKGGKQPEAREVYLEGGKALLEKINQAKSLKEVQSLLGGTIALLIQGRAYPEAQNLARRAIQTFPDDFLYYHRLAGALKEDGKITEAIAAQEEAFALSHGRNRTWVGNQLAELLLAQGELSKEKAKSVIEASLQSVNWETNTRKKELGFKKKLETLLALTR